MSYATASSSGLVYQQSYSNTIAVTSTSAPQNLAFNYTNQAVYYVIPSGTTVTSTNTYNAPAGMGSNPLKATSTTVTQPLNLTYYASLPYGQNVAPGVYTDTVVIQVTF